MILLDLGFLIHKDNFGKALFENMSVLLEIRSDRLYITWFTRALKKILAPDARSRMDWTYHKKPRPVVKHAYLSPTFTQK